MSTRNGTSVSGYQIAVRIVKPGVTNASIRPRKKLGIEISRERACTETNVPIGHEPGVARARRRPGRFESHDMV